MIQIYKAENTDYEKNGDMTLFPQEAYVHPILNGAWEAYLEHPIDQEGRWKYLTEDAVVKMPSFNGEQLFRIKNVKKTDSGVTCDMDPIFFDAAGDCFLADVRPTGKTGQEALDIMTASNNKYKGKSDITSASTAYYEYKNLLEAISGDDDNSFLNRWGGEVLYDNFTITVNGRIGGDYGVSLLYGKNIQLDGFSQQIDMTNIITRIYPKAYDGYKMSGKGYVDSPLIGSYPTIHAVTITFDEVRMKDDTTTEVDDDIILCKSQEELDAALKQKCEEQYTAGVDKPEVTIKADTVLLEYTQAYQDLTSLEKISLGDTVHCKHTKLNIITDARVIELYYDSIMKRNKSVVIGDFKGDYFARLESKTAKIDSVVRDNGTVVADKVAGILNVENTQLRYQKNVAKRQDVRAMLFEDMDPDSELFGAMCYGTQGFQIADERTDDGRDWKWKTAFTAKGGYADTIILGLLSDKTGMNYWNLDTGEFNISSVATVGGKTVDKIVEDNLSGFQKTLNGAFRDGVISEAEARTIEQMLWSMGEDKSTIERQYAAVIDSVTRKSAGTGNNLSIKFNTDCKSKVSSSGRKYDNLSLYYQKSGKIYKALDAVSGQDIAGNTYIVPSTDIYVQWYSDSSNCNYYGFSIDAITRTNAAATLEGSEGTLPNYEVIEATMASAIQTSHPYESSMQKLWHYRPRTVTRSVLENKMLAYKNAYDSLKSAIDSAIEDKEIAGSDAASIGMTFNTYVNARADLEEALKEASVDIAAIAAAAATDYARAAIKVEADKITLKVSKTEVESIIEQKAESIRLKASKISWTSDYSSMTEDGTLTCQNANIMGTLYSQNGKMKTYLRNGSLCLIYNDNDIGMIGTNEISGYSGRYGLNFDLDYTGEYMAWAAQTSSTSLYALRWTFARNSIANLTGGALNAGCDIDMHNWTLKNPSFEGGGINGTINFTHILNMNSDGSCRYSNGCHMQFKNGILVSGSWSNG